MLHFGSDEGTKMTVTYHSIISTVKLQGRCGIILESFLLGMLTVAGIFQSIPTKSDWEHVNFFLSTNLLEL